jgi:hypothetical protein
MSVGGREIGWPPGLSISIGAAGRMTAFSRGLLASATPAF